MATKRSGMGTDPLSWILEPGDSTRVDTPPKTPPREHEHVDILEIRDTPLSLSVADYFLCTICATVVRDHGHDQDQDQDWPLCPHCGKPINEAPYYFKKPVHTIIDLMQAAYHWHDGNVSRTSPHDQRVALVIFFCQLADLSFDHFLRRLMFALRLPPHVAKRLLADHADFHARVARLFPALTGADWRPTVEALASQSSVDYVSALTFRRKAVTLKNSFLGTGDSSTIDAEAAKTCMLRIAPLLDLHVALHNRFVPTAILPASK